jgi:hypothetical protein
MMNKTSWKIIVMIKGKEITGLELKGWRGLVTRSGLQVGEQ